MREEERFYIRDKLINNLETIEKKLSNDRRLLCFIFVLIIILSNSGEVEFSIFGFKVENVKFFLLIFPAAIGYIYFQYLTKEFYRRSILSVYSKLVPEVETEQSIRQHFLFYWPYNYKNVEDLVDIEVPGQRGLPIRYGLIFHKATEIIGPLAVFFISILAALLEYKAASSWVIVSGILGFTYITHGLFVVRKLVRVG
ncbi:membrane hypothetical protein [Vibrio jasicida]|uniref:hypothetical protein n=2 Tax=Vibrio harveyi group TaxID=717610 RepID=UPI002893B18B|nr:membrane hypothetical protein [Vibrio jasicida]